VLEVWRRAEGVGEGLARGVGERRGVVRMPEDGYPLKWVERDAVEQALQWAGWVQAGAAKLLHVSPRVLHYKVHRLGIRVPAGVRVRKWKEAG